MKLLAFPWQLRVIAALLLAALLQMSDGDALWTDLLPDLLTAGALVTVLVMAVRRRRAHPPATG